MSKDENMHNLIPRKDILNPDTFSSSSLRLPALFSSPIPLLARAHRLQGFRRNEWVISTGTYRRSRQDARGCVC